MIELTHPLVELYNRVFMKDKKRRAKRTKAYLKELRENNKAKKIVNNIKSYYPEGTDLKELSKNLILEMKQRQMIKKWYKENTLTVDEYFQRSARVNKNK